MFEKGLAQGDEKSRWYPQPYRHDSLRPLGSRPGSYAFLVSSGELAFGLERRKVALSLMIS
jgi:hypothetical protein